MYLLVGCLAICALTACSTSGPTAFSGPIARDIGDIAVIQDTGDLVNLDPQFGQPDLISNGIPAARKFYTTHPPTMADVYDFLVIFTSALIDRAWYFRVQNYVQGIGISKFDITAQAGSRGRLQGIIFMGGVRNRISRGSDEVPEPTLNLLAEEMGHQWVAYVRFRGIPHEALLGRDHAHWSPLFDTGGSALEGFGWRNNQNGTFTAAAYKRGIYSPLDLYLMGFYSPGEVPPMLLILSPDIDQNEIFLGQAPIRNGTTISGTESRVTVDDIIAAEGQRLPEASEAQKTFRAAFLLVTAQQPELSDIVGIDAIRRAWSERFHQITHGRGTLGTTLERVNL